MDTFLRENYHTDVRHFISVSFYITAFHIPVVTI